MIAISAPTKSHLLFFLRGMSASGWRIQTAPERGILNRNGQLIVLKSPKEEIRIRLFVYKVTESGRGKTYERRIEITTTYPKGLERRIYYRDIVLGYDDHNKIFVGVDPRRLK